MDIAWRILTNTPIWVFALLALLIWLGSLSFRPRKTELRRLLIVPMVLTPGIPGTASYSAELTYLGGTSFNLTVATPFR